MSKGGLAVSTELLFQRVSDIWLASQSQATRAVNSALVQAHWLIGQQIVESEQVGDDRAGYGKQVLSGLSRRLNQQFGRGFSVSSLQYSRSFYLAYPALLDELPDEHLTPVPGLESRNADSPSIQHTVCVKSDSASGLLNSALSWSHYRSLLKIERQQARNYYEQEAVQQGWSVRELQRQIASLSYDRLVKTPASTAFENPAATAPDLRPVDVIKDPYVLEFLDVPESSRFQESDLESALLTQLQAFLLELGKGFAFIGRQMRISLDGDHFYPDLVFYHIKLKCYVVVELKLGRLNHGDLGQMQFYVHYYDREVRESDDNPTVGLILCSEKNDAVVRYVLDEEQQQIFASRYKLHMPTEEQLQQEIQRKKALLESHQGKRS
ncbi:hypothetical protein AB833_02110 [Chromatiales bacterium (ex Bugula neritina AB1)]|nr:hypothetical protein AB833_02110 [Chromatiales bacterium (ex Bugula neritina AB1)]